jgi:hypothetical protein
VRFFVRRFIDTISSQGRAQGMDVPTFCDNRENRTELAAKDVCETIRNPSANIERTVVEITAEFPWA